MSFGGVGGVEPWFENIVGQAAAPSLDFSSFICKFGMEPLLLQLSFHLQSKNH